WLDTIYIAVILLQGTYTPLVYAHDGRTQKKILLGGILLTLLTGSTVSLAQNYQAKDYQVGRQASYTDNYQRPSAEQYPARQGDYYTRYYRPGSQLLPPVKAQSPAELLEKSIKKVINYLSRPKEASLKQIILFLKREITPHFDFKYMARWVAGRYFRTMSPQQQKEFTENFSELFTTTFVQKLSNYQNYPPVVDSFRSKRTGNNEALASARILQENGGYIHVDFKFLKTPRGWKVVDVRANGVSALYYYRNFFAEQIRKRQQQDAVFH
ncbi:MAG: ABC transporter substrate-binding protein, partial [gamma proteobacterium symbiont of Lucinoma myriamae]|nr:ABC transporter substrate-binding protein [gamma proteobacterium symbiont of Lucinoma myriamae]